MWQSSGSTLSLDSNIAFAGKYRRSDGVSVELRRRSGACWMQMVRGAAKSSTVSPVTVSGTVESPQRLPAIADVAQPVKAADVQISGEGRDARVKTAPAEPSKSESVLHSATFIPFWAWCSACVASRALEDPHWRKRTEDAQEKGTTSYRSTPGSSAAVQLGGRLRRTSVWWMMSLAGRL